MGDREQVLEKLKLHLERAVRRLCPRSLWNDQDDLVQTLLLRFLQILDKDPDREMTAAFVHRCVRNLVVDEIRRRQRRPETPLLAETEGFAAAIEEQDPERMTRSQQLAHAITTCLAKIVESRRRALALNLGGHPIREIAEILKIAPKTCENLVTRGRGDLRRCLEQGGWHHANG